MPVHRSVSSALILLKTVDDKFPLLAFGLRCIKHVPRRCRHELTRMFHTCSISFLSYHTPRLLCKIPRCTKCLNPGHTPLKIALSPLLFQREITQNGVIFKKVTSRSSRPSVMFEAGRARRCLNLSGERPRVTAGRRTMPARLTRNAGGLLWPTSSGRPIPFRRLWTSLWLSAPMQRRFRP